MNICGYTIQPSLNNVAVKKDKKRHLSSYFRHLSGERKMASTTIERPTAAAIIQLFITALAWSDMATVMISYQCITNIFEFKFNFLVDVVP